MYWKESWACQEALGWVLLRRRASYVFVVFCQLLSKSTQQGRCLLYPLPLFKILLFVELEQLSQTYLHNYPDASLQSVSLVRATSVEEEKFLRAGFLKLARSWYIMDCGATSASCQKINDVHKKDDQCKHAKLSYCLGAVIIHLISIKTTKHVYMRSNFSLRNSSTLSVFHLRMLSSSAMFPLSSKSFSTGSEPRTYLICRPLKSLGLSLLTKAWTWGNLPNFHPQTSRMAPAYSFLVSNCASSWQHPLQTGSSGSRLNCPRRSQELQSKLLEKPNSLHASDANSAPRADAAWNAVASSKRSPRAGRSHPPCPAAIPAVCRQSSGVWGPLCRGRPLHCLTRNPPRKATATSLLSHKDEC